MKPEVMTNFDSTLKRVSDESGNVECQNEQPFLESSKKSKTFSPLSRQVKSNHDNVQSRRS